MPITDSERKKGKTQQWGQCGINTAYGAATANVFGLIVKNKARFTLCEEYCGLPISSLNQINVSGEAISSGKWDRLTNTLYSNKQPKLILMLRNQKEQPLCFVCFNSKTLHSVKWWLSPELMVQHKRALHQCWRYTTNKVKDSISNLHFTLFRYVKFLYIYTYIHAHILTLPHPNETVILWKTLASYRSHCNSANWGLFCFFLFFAALPSDCFLNPSHQNSFILILLYTSFYDQHTLQLLTQLNERAAKDRSS